MATTSLDRHIEFSLPSRKRRKRRRRRKRKTRRKR